MLMFSMYPKQILQSYQHTEIFTYDSRSKKAYLPQNRLFRKSPASAAAALPAFLGMPILWGCL